MKKNGSVAAINRIVETYGDDVQTRIKELKRALRERQLSGDILAVGAAYCHLAEAYSALDDLHGALINSLKAVTVLKNTCEHELLAKSYFSLGQAYTYQGFHQMALVCDELAYGIVKRHRIKGQTRIIALNNLSVSYHVMEEPKKSIKCLNECIALLKKEYPEEYTDLLMYSINLSGCHKDIGELDRAEEILGSLSAILDKVDFYPLVCDYYLRRAIVAYLREDISAGDGYMDAAFEIFPKTVFPLPLYDDLCEVARMITKRKDRARSDIILGIMTVYAEKNAGTMEQLFATSMMANYYKDFGEYELASNWFSKYEELNTRQTNEQKSMQLKLHETMRRTEAEIRRLNRKMRESEARYSLDPLTGLLNRSALLTVSSEFIAAAAHKKQKVGVIFIDIDYFKECNDTYGHARGDEIIKEVARVCKAEENANIKFARYGGDEFFGITRGLTDAELAEAARRICRAVRELDIPNEKSPCGGRLTLSAGVANVVITARTDTVIEIANYADKAVYYAKRAGKDAVYFIKHESSANGGSSSEYVKVGF